MDQKRAEVHALSRQGDWGQVFPLLRAQPTLVNAATEPKGYTTLHQAAWHGASIEVVGELLALGADRSLLTVSKRQTAAGIAAERHPDRDDLGFLLNSDPRTLAQLMRKVQVEHNDLFSAYDGNQVLYDRLVQTFGADICKHEPDDPQLRVSAALRAVLGEPLPQGSVTNFNVGSLFEFQCDGDLWEGRITSRLTEYLENATAIPIEPSWAVIGDLFTPYPEGWGLRGDLFLWLELQQALCHVSLPDEADRLARMLDASFLALTGCEITALDPVYVKRFDRGGMSSCLKIPSTKPWQ